MTFMPSDLIQKITSKKFKIMTPETEEKLLKTLQAIDNKLEEDLSDYCNAKQAVHVMSLGDPRQLNWLVEKGYISKYPRGNGFRYKRSVLRKVAEMIDRSEIELPAYKKS